MFRYSIFALCFFFFSCETIKQLPSVPKEVKTTDRISSKEEVFLKQLDSRSDGENMEFDFQIRDSQGTLYQMKSVDDVIQKVEIFENGRWKEIELSQVNMLPSSTKTCIPRDYCIFLDLSGSMFDERDIIFREAKEFIDNKNDSDYVAIIKFGSEAIITSDYSADVEHLTRALNNRAEETMKRGTRTPVAYQTFLDSLSEHPNEKLTAIIFSDLSGFYEVQKLDPMFRSAFLDSVETHRIIYREHVRRGLYTKKGKKKILDTYDFPYGSSYIVENLGSIGQYLSHRIDEDCLVNTIQLPIYKEGENRYRIQLKVGEKSTIVETEYNNIDSSTPGSADFTTDTTNILDLQFETGSDSLLPKSLIEIKKVRDFLNAYPEVNIEIKGHTDNQGKYEYNMDLSQRRSEAVLQELIKLGIRADRLKAIGFGYNQPIATNDTPAGRQKNRRTEFVVVK